MWYKSQAIFTAPSTLEPSSATKALVADIRRLELEVGWRPAVSLEAGLAATIEWWRTQLSQCGCP